MTSSPCPVLPHELVLSLATFFLTEIAVRTDRYGVYYLDGDGDARVRQCAQALTETVLAEHFRATKASQVTCIPTATTGAGETKLIVIDLDAHAEEGREERMVYLHGQARAIEGILDSHYGVGCVVDGSPRGIKIWLRTEEAIPVDLAQRAGRQLALRAGCDPDVEVLPKLQGADTLPGVVRVPGLHPSTGTWSTFYRDGQPVPSEQWADHLLKWAPCPHEVIDDLATEQPEAAGPSPQPKSAHKPSVRTILVEGVSEGHRHDALVRVAAHARAEGLNRDELTLHLRAANQNFQKPLKTEDVDRIAADYAKKKTGPKKGKKEELKEYCAWFMGLVDVVVHDGRPRFLVRHSDGSFHLREEAKVQDAVVIPPPAKEFPYRLVNADALQPYLEQPEPQRALFEDLCEFFRSGVELPCERTAVLLAAWTLLTYRQEQAEYFPILFLYGPPERGKSRVGKLITFTSFRGTVAASVREANLFRFSHNIHAMIFLDLADPWKALLKAGAEDLILHAYERGGTVSRVFDPGAGPFRDMKHYEVYGGRILASNRDVPEHLRSRALAICMPESSKAFFPPIDQDWADRLRVRCVAYRAVTLGTPLPTVAPACRGRLADITLALLAVAHDCAPRREADLREWIQEEQQRRDADRGESLDGRIVAVLVEKHDDDEKRLFIKDIVRELENDDSAVLSRWKDPNQGVGYALKRLGIETDRDGRRGKYVQLDEIELKPLAAKYNILLEGEKATQPRPEKPSQPSQLRMAGSNDRLLSEGSSGLFTGPSSDPSQVQVPQVQRVEENGRPVMKLVWRPLPYEPPDPPETEWSDEPDADLQGLS